MTYDVPTDYEEGEILEDRFHGEYGTNMYVPGIREWARDMRVPWYIAEMRNCISGSQSTHKQS